MAPPTTPPTPTQLLKEAKRKKTQADKAYAAAADLHAKATETVAKTAATMNQALSEKIAAERALDAAIQVFRDGPDEP